MSLIEKLYMSTIYINNAYQGILILLEKWDGLDLVINKDRLRCIRVWLGDELVQHLGGLCQMERIRI